MRKFLVSGLWSPSLSSGKTIRLRGRKPPTPNMISLEPTTARKEPGARGSQSRRSPPGAPLELLLLVWTLDRTGPAAAAATKTLLIHGCVSARAGQAHSVRQQRRRRANWRRFDGTSAHMFFDAWKEQLARNVAAATGESGCGGPGPELKVGRCSLTIHQVLAAAS